MKSRHSFFIVFIFTILSVSVAIGKIGDPKPITKDNIQYQSHRHTVWATNLGTKKALWKTTIPMATYRGPVDPHLEEDIQWNIISSLRIEGQILIVKNSKGESFNLNSVTGKLITKRQQSGAKRPFIDVASEDGSDPLLEDIKKSASEDDADAQCLLANLYRDGDGIEKNLMKAAELYRLAAQQGHDLAQLKLGYCCRDGIGLQKDKIQAYVWFNISANNGGVLNGKGRAGELMEEIRETLTSKQLETARAEVEHLEHLISTREKKNYTAIIRQLSQNGWTVTMRKDDDGSHNVIATKNGNTSISHAPNWRVAFISVWQQCEKWSD